MADPAGARIGFTMGSSTGSEASSSSRTSLAESDRDPNWTIVGVEELSTVPEPIAADRRLHRFERKKQMLFTYKVGQRN